MCGPCKAFQEIAQSQKEDRNYACERSTVWFPPGIFIYNLCLAIVLRSVVSELAGINHRFYQGYHPEDFIGKVSAICSAGSNANLEYVALKRFFVG